MNRRVRLVAITDRHAVGNDELLARLNALAERAVPGSVAVLLRDHDADARQRLVLGRALRLITQRTGQQLWVADRLDLALLLEADGAHLGEESVGPSDARRLLGRHLQLSRAWHRADLAGAEPELDGVDALLVSPIFAARKGRPALGVEALAALSAVLQPLAKPPGLYALGGVTPAEVAACDAAGAAGVAAIGAALASDPMPLLDALGIGLSA